MPELDYMLLADHVGVSPATTHVLGLGVDTITAAAFPANHTLHVLVRLRFDPREEAGKPHLVALTFSGSDRVLRSFEGSIPAPQRPDDMPVHWSTPLNLTFVMELPLPEPGDYAFDLAIDDEQKKSVDIRAVRSPEPAVSA